MRDAGPWALWKLTDAEARTRGGTAWGPGVTHEAPGTGELCNARWLHAYPSTLLAVLLNPLESEFDPTTMRLWRAEGRGRRLDEYGLKVGVTSLTTVEEVPLPVVSLVAGVRFVILCASAVTDDPAFHEWADEWRSGRDRSALAAETAARVVATVVGSRATRTVVWAANSASLAAEAGGLAARGADVAMWDAVAEAVVTAAWAAAETGLATFELSALAEQAVREAADEATP